MERIGLTGMSGSGKSFVSSLFEEFGIPVINTDRLVHTLYREKNPCTEALAACFGSQILDEDHAINRRVLAEIVFRDKQALALLNATVHPFVIAACREAWALWEKAGKRAVVIEAPQLFEAGLDKLCDCVVAVIASRDTCLKRILLRDHLSVEQVEQRLCNQYDEAFFLDKADFCIRNEENDDIPKQIRAFLEQRMLLA